MLSKVAEIPNNQDLIDRFIAYGGGGTVATASTLSNILQETTVADWALWISAMVLLGRLAFDIYKYFYPRDTDSKK